VRQTTLRVHPDVAKALNESEKQVFEEIEEYLGNVDITGDKSIHQEQFDFAFI
jgi:flagellar biosynthesis/type III secretory pathway protein FliH